MYNTEAPDITFFNLVEQNHNGLIASYQSLFWRGMKNCTYLFVSKKDHLLIVKRWTLAFQHSTFRGKQLINSAFSLHFKVEGQLKKVKGRRVSRFSPRQRIQGPANDKK